MEKLLTAVEVAERLGVKKNTIWDWSRRGKIPTVILPGGDMRYSPKALENWVANNTAQRKAI
jgi:excisionase family DNA binding protein